MAQRCVAEPSMRYAGKSALIAYGLIRREMASTAREAKLALADMSFVRAFHVIRYQMMWAAVMPVTPNSLPAAPTRRDPVVSNWLAIFQRRHMTTHHYSAATGGLYVSDDPSELRPDAVEISEKVRAVLFAGNESGLTIVPGTDGAPTCVTRESIMSEEDLVSEL